MDKQTLMIAVVGFVLTATLYFVYKGWSLWYSEKTKIKILTSQQAHELAIMNKNHTQRDKDNTHAIVLKTLELDSKYKMEKLCIN